MKMSPLFDSNSFNVGCIGAPVYPLRYDNLIQINNKRSLKVLNGFLCPLVSGPLINETECPVHKGNLSRVFFLFLIPYLLFFCLKIRNGVWHQFNQVVDPIYSSFYYLFNV